MQADAATGVSPSLGRILKRCVAATTAHGLSRTASDRSRPVRLFWLVLFVSMIGLFIRNSFTFINQLRFPLTTSSFEADSLDFEFPDLYFCFDSPFSGSRYLTAGAQVAAEVTARFANVTSIVKRWCSTNSSTNYPGCNSMPILSQFLYTNSLPLGLAIEKLGRTLAQTVMEAKMSVGSGLKTTVVDLQLTEFYHPYHLTCFRLSLSDAQRALLNTPGPFNSVFITLMLDAQDDRMAQPAPNASFPSLTDLYGHRQPVPRWMLSPEVWFTSKNQPEVRIYIVSPGRYPNPFETNMLLEGGKFHTLQLSMQEESYDISQFGNKKCLPRHDDVYYLNPYNSSTYRFKYSKEYCYYSLLQLELEQAANSSSGYMPQPWPGSGKKSILNVTENEAFFVTRIALPNATSSTKQGGSSSSDSAQCDGQALCVQRRYFVTSWSSVPWPPGRDTSNVLALVKQRLLTAASHGEQRLPALEFADSLLSAAGANSSSAADVHSYLRDNWLRLRVTSLKNTANRISFAYAYSLDSFFGDVGGIMGMYLGMSVMTVCELVELLHDAILLCLSRRRKPKSVIKVSPPTDTKF